MHGACTSRLVPGSVELHCSRAAHEAGLHLAVGAFTTRQAERGPDGALLPSRMVRWAYRIAWTDDPTIGHLEV